MTKGDISEIEEMVDKNYIKSEFDLLKQILQDLGNINNTLALMNINKLFPSKAVNESIDRFYKERKEFVGRKPDSVKETEESKN